MAGLEEELFGDFESGDEGAAKPAAAAVPDEADLADELFGDGGGEDGEPQGRPKRSREARAGEGGKPAKRRKDISKFYELEAEEAGGSGDEEEDGDLEGLIDDSGVNEPGASRAQMQRAERELADLRKEMAERGKEGESGASRVFGTSFLDRMEEKYKEMEDNEAAAAAAPVPAPASPALSLGGKKETNAYVVPDPRDPKLWTVKTFGPEKGLCIALMRKASEWFSEGKPVPIYSVFYSEHLRGYIYIEAFKESDVRDFIRGISGMSLWQIQIVPIPQMPQVFTSSAMDADKHMLLKSGDWVRLKRGPYKGDLAMIDEVKDDTFVVKLKPRLRYGLEHQNKTDKFDKAHAKRPQPRWFNRSDIEAGGLMVNTEKRFTPKGYLTFFIVDGESYRDGFLYKSYKSHWLETGDRVRPLEHELQDWRFVPPVSENTRPAADLAKTEDSKLMPPPAPMKRVAPQRAALTEGDVVIVHSGDLKNLRGVVTQALFGATTVLVKPLDVANLEGELNISVSLLSKYFQVGDYVKAIGGEHEGDTGYVLKVMLDAKGGWTYNAMARVLSTSIAGEFNARIDHLQLSAQKAEPQDAVGEFAVEQLVRLEGRQNSRGMIIRLEAGTRAIVLCTDGSKHDVSFGDLEPVALPDKRMYAKTVWTLDKKGKKIMPTCMVKCPRTHARTAPIKAIVLYIHNEFCFLKATEALTGERAYLVCPGNKCEFVFSTLEQRQNEKEKKNEQVKVTETYGVVMASETDWLQPWFKKMIGIEDERGKGIQKFGAPVRIHGGSYKGLRGEVRDFLGDKVRISLLAKPKLVVVKVSDIAPDDYELPPSTRYPSLMNAAPQTPTAAPSTPFTPASPFPDQEEAEGLPALEGPKDVSAGALAGPGTPKGEAAPLSEAPDGAAVSGAPAPATPLAIAAPAHQPSDTDEATSTHAPSKRRKPRLPPSAGDSADKAADESSRQVSQSPSALFGQPERPRSNMGSTDSRASWLVTGVGVRYTRDSKPCTGWIVKVYADMAHVVSSTAEIGDDSDMHAVKGSDTLPVECGKRGAMVYVFDGPRRGTKGKVVGIEKESVYVRVEHADRGKHTLLFATASGSDLVRVPIKDVAGFSRDWEKAAEERRNLPPAQSQPTATQAGEAGEVKASEAPAKPWWDVDSAPGSRSGGAGGSGTAPADTPRSPSSPAPPATGEAAGATGAADEPMPQPRSPSSPAPPATGEAAGATGAADEPMPPADEAAAAPPAAEASAAAALEGASAEGPGAGASEGAAAEAAAAPAESSAAAAPEPGSLGSPRSPDTPPGSVEAPMEEEAAAAGEEAAAGEGLD